MNATRPLALAAALLVPLVALAGSPRAALKKSVIAAEPQVAVQADVVLASTKPGKVDPSLTKMQETLAAKVRYLTLTKLSTKTLELGSKMQSVALPNAKTAEISLQGMKENVATVHVKLAPADATYTLGHDKSLYLQAGPHEGSDLWLVLSQPK